VLLCWFLKLFVTPAVFFLLMSLETLSTLCNSHSDAPSSFAYAVGQSVCGLLRVSALSLCNAIRNFNDPQSEHEQVGLYILKFVIMFAIIVAMNTNLERLRLELYDMPTTHSTTMAQLARMGFVFDNWCLCVSV
jgi:hypothetical protein